MSSYVYILTNPSFSHIKIGFSSDPNRRIEELDGTGVPAPFNIAYTVKLDNPQLIERKVHHALRSQRVRAKREFFDVSLEDAIDCIRKIAQENGQAINEYCEYISEGDIHRVTDFSKWEDQRLKEEQKRQKLLEIAKKKKRKYEQTKAAVIQDLDKTRSAFIKSLSLPYLFCFILLLFPVPVLPINLNLIASSQFSPLIFFAPYLIFFGTYVYLRWFWSKGIYSHPVIIHSAISLMYRNLRPKQHLKLPEQLDSVFWSWLLKPKQNIKKLNSDERVCPDCFVRNRKSKLKEWYQAKCGKCGRYLGY